MATTPQDCGDGAGGGPDVEQTLLCDIDADGNVVGTALAVYQYDENGAPQGAPTFVDPTTGAAYVPTGTMQPCGESVEVESHILCDQQDDESVVFFVRHYVYNEGVLERTYDTNLAGAVYNTTGTVGECEPDATCTPSPAVDLQAECGPGEAVDGEFVADQGVSPDSRVETDPAADPLCGGTWVRPGDPQNAPFPVAESFRNENYDQPGPVTQGSPGNFGNGPYFALTADPANQGLGNPPIPADAPGEGWGRGSESASSFSNGLWQVPTAFPTTQGMTFEATLASHTGSQPIGGDGMIIGFTDGGVPPQGAAVGGGGGLGAGNWEGGYVGVVFDEFGGLTGVANTIQIRRIGPGQGPISPAITVAPNFFNQSTRAQPFRARVSIIEQFGQTFVSASIDWNDGQGYIQYFDRFRVDDVAGPAPATLRMGINMSSGGAFRSVKEIRDAVANQGGVQYWRQFPITTDPLEDCVTSVDLTVCVDHQFDAVSQQAGDGEPDAWLWLVDIANDTVLASRQWSGNPATVGQPQERCVTFEDVDPADLPNIRVVVGAETRDNGETFDHTFDNLRVTALGQGCPVEPVRTVPISAPCPIPVTIVGGDAEGGGGGTAEFNAPSTVAYSPICAVVNGDTQSAFLREIRNPDGTTTIDFLGEDGIAITPEQWTPGGCAVRDTEIVELCDVQPNGATVVFLRRFTFDENGDVVQVDNLDANGDPYVVQGNADACVNADVADRERICYTLNGDEDTVLVGWARHDDDLFTPFTVNGITFFDGTGNPIDPNANQFTQVPCGGAEGGGDVEAFVLCDNNGNSFVRTFVYNEDGTVASSADHDDDGTPYVPANPVQLGACEQPEINDPTDYQTEVIDATGGVVETITPNGDLVAWTVRNRNATTATIQVNGGDVLPLDNAETIGSSLTGHDVNDVLADEVVVDPGDGSVRLVIQRRV